MFRNLFICVIFDRGDCVRASPHSINSISILLVISAAKWAADVQACCDQSVDSKMPCVIDVYAVIDLKVIIRNRTYM